MRQVVARAARHADGLITGTAAARDEIVDELGLDPAEFTVVHHGVTGLKQTAPSPEPEVRARFGLGDRRVVLCVAAKRPHKNQEVLVRAATQLDRDIVVVLAGHPEPYDAELRTLAAHEGVEDSLVFADYLPAAELEALWKLAACAAFPTRAEGFGLPLIEALARDVPVAASDIPVLREVGGDIPVYFDPTSPQDAARAIAEAMRRHADGGPDWAAQYTWDAAARGTWQVYDRVLA
jgi:glycosyltransferase involved in cell wall biosynthesis